MTKDKKKPEVFDFDHDDGIASQMSDKQIEGMASSYARYQVSTSFPQNRQVWFLQQSAGCILYVRRHVYQK